MILLSDEEILVAINSGRKASDGILLQVPPEYMRDKRSCLKAQLKKVVEWGEEVCREHDKTMRRAQRRFCDECWQSLLKEIE